MLGFLNKRGIMSSVACLLTKPVATIKITETYEFDNGKRVYNSERPFLTVMEAADYYLQSSKYLAMKVSQTPEVKEVTIEWLDFQGEVFELVTIEEYPKSDREQY
jgi:hypothetical protein